MSAKWPAFGSSPKGAKLDNEKSHGHTDPNSGGGPAAPVVRNAKRVPDAQRGGPYQSGIRQYASTSIHGGRGGSGNPADRGSITPVGRQSTPSEVRNPNGGGGPQERSALSSGTQYRGGLMEHGQADVPGGHSTSVPSHASGPGNTGGKMYKRIAGNFTNKTKGANSSGTIGSYGRNPITSNT